MWYTDGGRDSIGRISPAGTATDVRLPSDSGPAGITYGPDGKMWFTETYRNLIGTFSPSTPSHIKTFPVPTPHAAPESITAGPDGALWFTEYNPRSVGRITTDGSITEYPVAAAGPTGIATGPDGYLWITQAEGNRVSRFPASDPTQIEDFPLSTPFSEPSAIVAGPDGNMWFTEQDHVARILVAVPHTITEFPVTPTPSTLPEGLAVGPDGALWYTLLDLSQVGRITTSGSTKTFDLPTANAYPLGVAEGPDARMWFAESNAARIARVAPIASPSVVPSPDSGPPDALIDVEGGGFGALERISITFTDALGARRKIGSVVADTGGSFRVSVRIPAAAATGEGRLGATGATSHLRAHTPFMVT